MRELPTDIIQEMRIRFDSDFDSVHKILTKYVKRYEYLDSDRVIRCVIYLSNKGIDSFKSYLEAAKGDPRDVMWWAEYKNHTLIDGNERIRDFDKTFPENSI